MKKLFWVILFLAFTFTVRAQFVHPGMLHTGADLEFLKTKVRSGEEPWKTAWQQLCNSDAAQLDARTHAISHVANGPYSHPDNGGEDMIDDGDIAYTMALLYYVTDEPKYADKAIEVLNAWSYVLDSVTHHNRQLMVGIAGIKYLNAAEILKCYYDGWSKKDQEQFRHMVLDIWYPVIVDFVPTYNGNWDAALVQTMLCMGIFYDRQDIFDRAYEHVLNGNTNGAIDNYFMENGQCQESGRDQGHVQMGLGYLANCCEIAWNQGRDLYGAYGNRLMKGFEYSAKYNLGEEVPHVQYIAWYGRPVYGPEISEKGRGRFYPIYESVYRHYVGRKGLEMPYTWRVIEQTRNQRDGDSFVPWQTLMFAGYPTR